MDFLTIIATQKLLDLFRMLFGNFEFPKSLPTIKLQTGFIDLTKDMTVYATCPKCYSVYLYATSNGLTQPGPPQICTFINILKKIPCQTPLFQNGSDTPIKKFVYHCLISSIQKLYLREGFEEKCEEWRSFEEAVNPIDMMYHCSQGKMWRSILSPSGDPFVNNSRSLCLTLNAG